MKPKAEVLHIILLGMSQQIDIFVNLLLLKEAKHALVTELEAFQYQNLPFFGEKNKWIVVHCDTY